jgi:hypothetical protein
MFCLQAVEKLEYNFAEFTKPDNLARAFHKAQDVALSEKAPLIFFDEFDATLPGHPYIGLKYISLLQCRMGGEGAETEDSYPVGRAIFVFAGGTAKNFDDFKTKMSK